MTISGSVTATFQGTRTAYFRAQQFYAPAGFTGQIYVAPWSVVVGDQLFGYAPTFELIGNRPIAGFANLASNTGKGLYNYSAWQFGNQGANDFPADGSNGGVLLAGNLYGQWNAGADVGSWRAGNDVLTINPIVGGLVTYTNAPTLATVNGRVGAVVQLYTGGQALFCDSVGQSVLPTFWDVSEQPSFGGVVFNGQTYLMSVDGGGDQKVQVVVNNGVEQIRHYMYLDDPVYNDLINNPAYASACVFTFSNGYMIARTPYLLNKLIVINGDCSKWWLYDCQPVNYSTRKIMQACVDTWGLYNSPTPIMSPLGYLVLSGLSAEAAPDIYSSYVLVETNPNILATPGERLPIANCWNCIPTSQGAR